MLRVFREQFEDSYPPIRTFSKDIGESAPAIDSKLEFALCRRWDHYENGFAGRQFCCKAKHIQLDEFF